MKNRGFTLVETIIYTAIFSMFIYAIYAYMFNIDQSKYRNNVILDVNYGGNYALDIMTNSIKNASSIASPAISNSLDTLSLNMPVSSVSPTMFYVATGTLYMKEGTNNAVAITSNRLNVSDMVFSNYTRPSTSGTVNIKFKISNASNLTRDFEQYSKSFYSSATIRK